MHGKLAPVLVAALLSSANARAQTGIVHIVIETAAGTIDADLDSARAPITVTNFLRYVDAHAYDGGMFHRTVKPDNQPNNTVKIEVIQGSAATGSSSVRFPAIELERTSLTRLSHTDFALSMARAGVNTATSDFFITIGSQPELDFGGKRNADGQGFAVFGHVVKGSDVVRKIQQSPAVEQNLAPPIAITRIVRKSK